MKSPAFNASADAPAVRILVVDDNPENLRIVGKMLERNIECDLDFAQSGEDALVIVKENPPEVILLDVIMPGMDGFEVCRRLKAAEKTADIPVLFLTALIEEEHLVKGFEAGAEDYIAKPFQTAELLARVKTHVKIARAKRTLAAKNEELRQLLHILCHDLANPVSNMASLIELCQSPEEVQQILPTLAGSARDSLAIIDMVRQMRAIEEGKLQPKLVPVDLRKACADALENLRGPMSLKKIHTAVEVPERLSVQAEPVALVHSVLANVFSNAIKFSYQGECIEVRAELLECGEVCLEVRDVGIGIPVDLLADLFDITRQTSRPGTRGEGGTGFGMVLVKNFMASFGGRIEITSRDRESHTEDHGTEVRLFFSPGSASHSVSS